MSEKCSEDREMSSAAEAVRSEIRGHVRQIVGLSDESRKAGLAFAAKVLRLPASRVKQLFYGEARRIEAHEADQVRAYVDAAQKLIHARADYEALRQQFLRDAGPALARFAPGKLAEDEVSQAAKEAAASTVAEFERRKRRA